MAVVPKNSPNLGLFWGWRPGDDQWGDPVNWNWLLLDALVNPSCISSKVKTPPESPNEGDKYIIPISATGEWAGRTGQIAYFITGQWNFFEPRQGWRQYIQDEEISLVYLGNTWVFYVGDKGDTPSLRRTETAVQWSVPRGEWKTLFLMSEVKGEIGDITPELSQARDDAVNAALDAEQQAGIAQGAAGIAIEQAEQAEGYADAASLSAGVAGVNAGEAEGFASAAEQSAQDALLYSQNAESVVAGNVFDDGNVSSTRGWTSQKIDAELGNKVTKVSGKNLSTEDFSTAYKNKLDTIQEGAQVNDVPVDDLLSDSASLPLSANQGRVLKGLIEGINLILQADDTDLDELQEIVDFIKLNREDLDSLSIASISGLSDALAGKQPVAAALTGTTASFTTELLNELNSLTLAKVDWNQAYSWGDHGDQNYATQTWVGSQGFLTSHQQIKTIASKSLVGSGDVTLGDIGAAADGDVLKKANNLSDLADAGTARGNLGGTTVGQALFTLTNPSAIRFLKLNADNSVTAQTAANFRTDIGGTTVGQNLFTATNPSAIRFIRINAANTVSMRTAAGMRSDIGIGSMATRNVTISSGNPTGGSNGDVWIKI